MATLHTVSQSPFMGTALASCLRFALPGSGILLFEDAVLASVAGSAVNDVIATALAAHRVFVLAPDLEARGIPLERILPGVEPVDHGGFVDLCTEYSKVQAWL